MSSSSPRLTTEHLLVDVFGISTATPAQRAACRILDGLPIGELAENPDVIQFVGGQRALSEIDGQLFKEVVLMASVRSAKTFIACSAALRMAQTVDLSMLGYGEVPRISIVSVKLDAAQVAYGYLRGVLEQTALRSLLVSDPTNDAITVRGAGGRPVEIACVAGAKAGSGLVARWSAGVIFDEAPRMAGRQDGVVNLSDARTAVLGRLLPGAQALYIGSPWAPFGTVHDLVQEFWERPSKHLVVLRGTGPILNPIWWTPERCEQLREADPVAYQTDVLGEFVTAEAGVFDLQTLRDNTRASPNELPYDYAATYTAGIDPSEGSATGNGWTLVIVERRYDDEGVARYRVAYNNEYRGMRPAAIWGEIAGVCARYGISEAESDQYAAAANQDLAAEKGLTLNVTPSTNATNLADYADLSTLTNQGVVEFPPDETFRRDLLSVQKIVTQQSQRILLPKTADGRHCDYAPALVKAMRAARSSTTPMIEAMRARIRNRRHGAT